MIMEIIPEIESRLKSMFPGVLLDRDINGRLLIRTNNWQAPFDDFCELLRMDLFVDSIYIEGDGVITFVINEESSRKVITY